MRSRSNWNLNEIGKPEYPAKKPRGARRRTSNKLNSRVASTPGFEAGHIVGRRVVPPLLHPWFFSLKISLHSHLYSFRGRLLSFVTRSLSSFPFPASRALWHKETFMSPSSSARLERYEKKRRACRLCVDAAHPWYKILMSRVTNLHRRQRKIPACGQMLLKPLHSNVKRKHNLAGLITSLTC